MFINFYAVDNSDCGILNCSHLCINATGSLTCACHPGYYLNTLNLRECEGYLAVRLHIQIVYIIILWQILMSVNFIFILVTSMPTVRTPLEATNASAKVVTVAMESYVMVS